MNLKFLTELVRYAVRDWSDNKATRLGAGLAYYSVFSIAPMVMIAVAIAGLVYGAQAARGEVFDEIKHIVGKPAAHAVEDLLANDNAKPASATMAVVSLGLAVLGASGVFIQLQDALNTIWKVTPRPGRGWVDVLRERTLSFVVVLLAGALLLLSAIGNTVLEALAEHFHNVHLPGGTILWLVVNNLMSVIVIAILFGMIFKILPDVWIRWRDVWIGAVVTAILFTLGKFVLGLYLGRASTTSAFGAAGSLVVILLWVYYSSQIVLLGASLTHVYAVKTRARILPADNAVPTPDAA